MTVVTLDVLLKWGTGELTDHEVPNASVDGSGVRREDPAV